MIETKMLSKLKEKLPYILFQDIETTTGVGIPDIWFSRKARAGWIELKELNRIPVKKFKMPWRPGQLGWYSRLRTKYKSTTPYYIIITLKDYWYVFNSDLIAMKEEYTMEEIKNFYVCETKDIVTYAITFAYMLGIND